MRILPKPVGPAKAAVTVQTVTAAFHMLYGDGICGSAYLAISCIKAKFIPGQIILWETEQYGGSSTVGRQE